MRMYVHGASSLESFCVLFVFGDITVEFVLHSML